MLHNYFIYHQDCDIDIFSHSADPDTEFLTMCQNSGLWVIVN